MTNKLIHIKNLWVFYLLIFIILLACGPEDIEPLEYEPPEINLYPMELEYKLFPGDSIKVDVRVEGEENFNYFSVTRFENEVEFEEEFILEKVNEPYEVPFEYQFTYLAKEQDINKNISYRFRIEAQFSPPSGGRLTLYPQQILFINVSK